MYCAEAEKTSQQREIGIIRKCISKLLIMRFVKGIDNHIRMREWHFAGEASPALEFLVEVEGCVEAGAAYGVVVGGMAGGGEEYEIQSVGGAGVLFIVAGQLP